MTGFSMDDNYIYFGFTLLNLSLLKHSTSFLTNSVTTILEWVEDELKKACVFIGLLTDELRSFSQISQQQLIRVEEEISLRTTHLAVMVHRLQKMSNLQLKNVDLQQ